MSQATGPGKHLGCQVPALLVPTDLERRKPCLSLPYPYFSLHRQAPLLLPSIPKQTELKRPKPRVQGHTWYL